MDLSSQILLDKVKLINPLWLRHPRYLSPMSRKLQFREVILAVIPLRVRYTVRGTDVFPRRVFMVTRILG